MVLGRASVLLLVCTCVYVQLTHFSWDGFWGGLKGVVVWGH